MNKPHGENCTCGEEVFVAEGAIQPCAECIHELETTTEDEFTLCRRCTENMAMVLGVSVASITPVVLTRESA